MYTNHSRVLLRTVEITANSLKWFICLPACFLATISYCSLQIKLCNALHQKMSYNKNIEGTCSTQVCCYSRSTGIPSKIPVGDHRAADIITVRAAFCSLTTLPISQTKNLSYYVLIVWLFVAATIHVTFSSSSVVVMTRSACAMVAKERFCHSLPLHFQLCNLVLDDFEEITAVKLVHG